MASRDFRNFVFLILLKNYNIYAKNAKMMRTKFALLKISYEKGCAKINYEMWIRRYSKIFQRFALCLSLFPWIWGDDSMIVTTEQGKLRGSKLRSRNGKEYRSFLGIPFAKPPVGELRFQSPQEPDTWNGVRDATILPPLCVQKDIFYKAASSASVEGEEDCLYLNVFSPLKVHSLSQLPVLVYIHGGGFVVGSGRNYLPDYFLDYNVVFVFIQYRLGPFGFLSIADSVIPGNYGMKDQSAALKWVKKNIAAFGGNPELVTILGESAGAASVHLHLYSPLSKGLFQRAISQSGSAFSLWTQSRVAVIRRKTLAFGMLVGCPVESSQVLLECLQKIPAHELMLAHHKFYVWDFEPTIPFAIVPEPESVEDAFLHTYPSVGSPINNVPWITGITSGEGAIRVARFLSDDGHLIKKVNENYKRLFPLIMNFIDWFDYHEIVKITEAVKQFYFGDEEIGFKTAENMVNMLTDCIFFNPCFQGMSQYTNTVYFYYYDHKNSISFADFFGNCSVDLGVSHVDDLISLFHFPSYGIKVTDGSDLDVSARLIERWVIFAQTGNPSIGDKPWDPFDANEVNYLHITSARDEMKKGLLAERLAFWKSIVSRSSNQKLLKELRDEL